MNALLAHSPEMATKVCRQCGKELPLAEFSQRSSNRDGLSHICKACYNENARANYARKRLGGAKNSTHPIKGSSDSPLANFTPRQLIDELRSRGYSGELKYTHTIKI